MATIQQVANPVYELTLDAEELKFLRSAVGQTTGEYALRVLGEDGIKVQDHLWDVLTNADPSYVKEF